MINAKFNLVCGEGHRHYSPTPESFVGRACLTPLERTAEGLPSKKKCPATLRKIRPYVRKQLNSPEPDGQRIEGGRIIATSR